MIRPLILKIVTVVGLPTAGAVATHLWTRYRRRRSKLRWTAVYQPMAFATQDFGWGEVQILYDGSPTQNLHMVSIELQNASPNDLENVRIDVVTDPGTIVLRSQGVVRGSLQNLPYSTDYAKVLERAQKQKLPQADIDFWSVRSPFLVPVLNRGEIIDLALLVSRFDHSTPTVSVGCDHRGVRSVHEPLAEEHLGVRQGIAQIVGVAVTAAAILVTVLVASPIWVAAVIGWVSGLFAMTIGALVVRAWRSLLSLAD